LQALKPNNELPQARQIEGIDICDGKESAEYVRGLREGA
jgi:hypothetical protein